MNPLSDDGWAKIAEDLVADHLEAGMSVDQAEAEAAAEVRERQQYVRKIRKVSA